jgi:hypothetical protein
MVLFWNQPKQESKAEPKALGEKLRLYAANDSHDKRYGQKNRQHETFPVTIFRIDHIYSLLERSGE